MAISKIKIYRTKITPDRNALVDDIEGYLNGLTPTYTSDNFQYQKLDVNLSIKIDYPQNGITTQSLGNYVKIEQDNRIWYYFILNTSWKSQNTIELALAIDSINTFRNDFHFNEKTQIIRQHMPRWKQLVKPSYKLSPQRITDITWQQGEYYSDKVLNIPNGDSRPFIATKGNNITFKVYEKSTQTLVNIIKCSRILFSERTIKIYKYMVAGSLTPDLISIYEDNRDFIWTIQLDMNSYISVSVLKNVILNQLSGLLTYTQGRYIALIDREPEALTTTKYLALKEEIKQELDCNWYLMYRTRDNLTPDNYNNPIECYCFADIPLLINRETTKPTRLLNPSEITPDKYYYISVNDNPNYKIRLKGENDFVVSYNKKVWYKLTSNQDAITRVYSATIKNMYFYQNGSKFSVVIQLENTIEDSQIGESLGTINVETYEEAITPLSTLNYSANQLELIQVNQARVSSTNDVNWNYITTQVTEKYNFGAGDVYLYTNTINDIDRTDSKIMKIIKLPYAPETIVIKDGIVKFSSDWKYTNGLMKLENFALSKEFENKDFTSVNFDFLIKNDIEISELKNNALETKIYHSNYSEYKLVYDSFVKDIQLENFHLKETTPPRDIRVNISFKPTNTINSKFAFKFNMEASSGISYYQFGDFDEFLLSSRNNEETLFSSGYIDYIRNGYNYDQKNRTLNSIQAGLSAVTSLASAGFGLAQLWPGKFQFASELAEARADSNMTPEQFRKQHGRNMPGAYYADAKQRVKLYSNLEKSYKQSLGPFSYALGQNAINAGSAISNGIFSWSIYNNNMEARLAQLASQSTAVSGTDDIDLLSYYCNNKLIYMEYKTIPEQLNYVYDTFYYTGYAHDKMEVPALNTRKWFNYIQCYPSFDEEDDSPYNNYVGDIKSRFINGVTVYHKVTNQYDWKQEKENMEVF